MAGGTMTAQRHRRPPITIRLKLGGALAPPLAALILVTVLELASALSEVRAVQQQTRLADASIGPLGLLNDLEAERDWAGVYLLGLEDAVTLDIEDSGQARALTDEAAIQLRDLVSRLDPKLRDAYEPAFTKLRDLAAARQQVDTYRGARNLANVDLSIQVFDQYSRVEDAFFTANEQVIEAIDDPAVRQGAHLALLSSRQTDLTARVIRDLVVAEVAGSAPDGLNTSEEIEAIASLQGKLRRNQDELQATREGTFGPYVEALFSSRQVTVLPGLVDEAVRTGHSDLGDVLAATTGGTGDSPYTTFRKAVAGALQRHAHHREDMTTAETRLLGGIAVMAVSLAVLVSLLVARSISRPLDALTRQARDIADRRLPQGVRTILDTPLGQDVLISTDIEPVRVRAGGEILDVAIALSSVQRTALDLAVEQAVLRRNLSDSFLNLGRRNQNLLARQLELITKLESVAAAPGVLGNLFRLDHLATRMRRNAESLLVLAGLDRPRNWATPVNIRDLVRAALGEVEDFRRVAAQSVTPVDVDGAAASDLAHLLAELIENALVHSPPDMGVLVIGAFGGDGYRLAVVDHGLGMTAQDLERANRRLSGTESFTVSPSRYLGHYVAGHLATRHDVHVRLQPSPVQGVTAVVDLPAALIQSPTKAVRWTGHYPTTPPIAGMPAVGA